MPDNIEFSILESILWKEGEFTLLEYHLRRMKNSATEFGFLFREEDFYGTLDRICRDGCDHGTPAKVRIFLSREGTMRGDAEHIVPILSREVKVWQTPIDPDNKFLYHKTTVRDHYREASEVLADNGYADILFFNKRGEMTEGTRANFFWREGEALYTPPVICGLLPGTYRASLLDLGIVREKVIPYSGLAHADKIFIGNSVRGLIEVNVLT